MGSGDGVAFLARADDNGRSLDGRCDVLVSGSTPQARFWTLTLYDPEGRLVANSIERQGFTSQEIVRRSDGSFEIVIEPNAVLRLSASHVVPRPTRAATANVSTNPRSSRTFDLVDADGGENLKTPRR